MSKVLSLEFSIQVILALGMSTVPSCPFPHLSSNLPPLLLRKGFEHPPLIPRETIPLPRDLPDSISISIGISQIGQSASLQGFVSEEWGNEWRKGVCIDTVFEESRVYQ
jgi:hypothetical protein